MRVWFLNKVWPTLAQSADVASKDGGTRCFLSKHNVNRRDIDDAKLQI